MLHLRRFEYDWQQDMNVKIMSKLEIFEELEMKKYLTKQSRDADPEDTVYQLFGILIHQGRASGSGHYITYIRPEMGQWYKFNDETVTKVDWKYVKLMSEGGSIEKISVDPVTLETGFDSYETNSTAYELIYIRKNQASKILAPITEDQIPDYVKESVKQEIEDYNRRVFLENHTRINLTSIDRLLGSSGAGCGIEYQGRWDSDHLPRFIEDQSRCMIYIAENRMTLDSFLLDIESKINLIRETYQIYKYNSKTLSWVPFLVNQSLKQYQVKTLKELLQGNIKQILMIVPIISG